MGQRPELILKLTENLPWAEDEEIEPQEEYMILGEWFGSDFEMIIASGYGEVVDSTELLELLERFKDYGPELRLGFS